MANEESIDPQYKYILPPYLTLLPSAQQSLHHRATDPTDPEASALFYINTLVSTTESRYWFEWDATYRTTMEAARRSAPECLQKEELINFAHRFECYKALKYIGLDMKGGLAQLHKARLECKANKAGFPTAAVMVVDAEMAGKQVDLGVCVGADVPEMPGTLDEAVDAYGKVKAVVGEVSATRAMRDGSEVGVWMKERRRYQAELVKRLRGCLVKLAHEEWLEEQVEELRMRKRVKIEEV